MVDDLWAAIDLTPVKLVDSILRQRLRHGTARRKDVSCEGWLLIAGCLSGRPASPWAGARCFDFLNPARGRTGLPD